MKMTHEEIFHTMTEEEVRYSLDAHQEANRRLQIAVDVAEKSFIRQHEEISTKAGRIEELEAEVNRLWKIIIKEGEVKNER